MGKLVGASHVAAGKNGGYAGAQVVVDRHGPRRGQGDTQRFQAHVLDVGVATDRQQHAVECQLLLAIGRFECRALAIGVPGDREVDMKRLEAQVAPAEITPFEEADFAANPALVKG